MSHPEAPQVLPELPAGLSGGFPAQGSWTYEDYCRIPDDGKRYEVDSSARSKVLDGFEVAVEKVCPAA